MSVQEDGSVESYIDGVGRIPTDSQFDELAFNRETGKYVFHGVALGEDDRTYGQKSKTWKRWPREALEDGAKTLKDQPLVKNHQNDVDGLVGWVTDAKYKPGTGVIYRAETENEELAKNIKEGRIQVSPRVIHGDPSEMEEDEDGNLVVQQSYFDNLSVVLSGASKSNSAVFGEPDELSAAELAAEFDYSEELDGTEEPDSSPTDDGAMNTQTESRGHGMAPLKLEEKRYDLQY